MARTLAEQLRRSLHDRATSFAAHVNALLAHNADAPRHFHDALALVLTYTVAVKNHTDRFWQTYEGEFDRLNEVKVRLLDMNEKERKVDQLFVRTGHSLLPRSLARRIAGQFAALGLPPELRPVLAVGAPGNFETRVEDWRGYLFHNLWTTEYDEMESYQHGQFALITVPYLEGTRAFWEPLVLGHEVAHVAIYYKGNLHVPGVSRNSYLESVVESIGLPSDVKSARSWTEEILCDLNMVRLYGPGGVAALAEMLSVADVESSDEHVTHPPRSLRLSLVLDIARRDTPIRLWDMLDPWSSVASEPAEDDPTTMAYIEAFKAGRDHLWDVVKAWEPDCYDVRNRHFEVDWIAKRLRHGIPGGLAEEEGGRGSLKHSSFLPADVVNAAWLAEMVDPPALPENTLDLLALKALDSMDFVRLWQMNPKGKVESEAFRSPHTDRSTGMLGRADICARLADHSDSGLVVTPLMEGSLGDAGLDVRLSSSFIVFKHSAIAVFDAIRRGQDPRSMQEVVEKEWGQAFILHPGELVLAATLEYLVLPNDLVAQLVTRSSYGRLGLITATAIQVQPGSSGVITLELVNLGQTPLALRAGQRIAQLVFHRLASPAESPEPGIYRYRTGPEFSGVLQDWDNEIIRGLSALRGPRDAHIEYDGYRLAQSGRP